MKREINGKTMLAAVSVCAVTAAVFCVNINNKETDEIVQTEQETESQEEATQGVTNREEQQSDKSEIKETQQEVHIPRNWSVGTIEAIDVSFERAFVIAGEKWEDGLIRGSLWYASKESCQLLAQNIVVKEAQATYFTMGVQKDCYLILDDEYDNVTKSNIWRYTDTRPELYLAGIEGKKEVAEYGLICYMQAYDSSCMITSTDDETIYAWTGRSVKPYFFQFGEGEKIRGVNTKVIDEAQLQELEHGTTICNQIKEAFLEEEASQGKKYTMQYLLRENDRLDVNIGIEYNDVIDFQYMSFDTQSGTCLEQGNGFYLTQMTGDAAVREFQNCFMGEGHILPIAEETLPMHMKSPKQDVYQDIYEPMEATEWQTLKEEDIYGVELEPQGELKQCLDGVIWNCSTEDTWLPWVQLWFDYYGEYGSGEESCNLAIIGQTKGFDVYAIDGPFQHMMVRTPDEKYVWIDYNSTCNYGGQPDFCEADFDQDGTKELLITGLCAGHGTGVNVGTLLMIDKNEKQEWVAYIIPYDWYQKELASYIETTHDDNGMQLWVDGEAVGEPVDVGGDTSAHYDGGCQIVFACEENRINLYSSLGIFSDSNFSGDYHGDDVVMELNYLGNGKWESLGCESDEMK